MINHKFPPIIFGTSTLGNLFVTMSNAEKQSLLVEYIKNMNGLRMPCFDSAGKYGAGLALETLGKSLKTLGVKPNEVKISNKLGWYRVPLTTPEPTFEQGIWKDLEFDAVQKISYDGIMECYEQGNELLDGYQARLVSVHDPDEYLAAATTKEDEKIRYQNILDAYEALIELKNKGKVDSIGVGSKDWRVMDRIRKDVKLDWVMIANSMTLHSHPIELLNIMAELRDKNIVVINSGVFNAGFLTGGNSYNYKPVDITSENGRELYDWRNRFYQICEAYKIQPAAACVQFGRAAPGVRSIALNTSNPERVKSNFNLFNAEIPESFWEKLQQENIVSEKVLEIVFNRKQLIDYRLWRM
jgi:D-threo-aldose 1-dehydrogenase